MHWSRALLTAGLTLSIGAQVIARQGSETITTAHASVTVKGHFSASR